MIEFPVFIVESGDCHRQHGSNDNGKCECASRLAIAGFESTQTIEYRREPGRNWAGDCSYLLLNSGYTSVRLPMTVISMFCDELARDAQAAMQRATDRRSFA